MTSPSKQVAAAQAAIAAHDRSRFLGGSDAAAVLGISPWRSRYRLWCEKVGTEAPPDLSDIDYIYFGHLLEPIVAQVFSERAGMKVRTTRKLYTHPKYKFLAGHVDREIVGKKAFLECKTANAFDFSKWGKHDTGPDGIPEHYLAQVDHYMLVRNMDECYVAALIGGNDFRFYHVPRSAAREKILLKAEVEFWEMVKTKTPPEITSERDARHRWAKILEGTAVEVGMDQRKKLIRLARVSEQIRTLDKEKDALRDELFPIFEDKEMLSMKGEPLARLNAYNRKYFDVDALREKHPKIAAKFTSSKPTKRIKILI